MEKIFIFTTVTVACLGAGLLVSGALVSRGLPLPDAEKLEEYVRSGLFPDKPRDMTFLEYLENCTGKEPDGNLTAALERLEFGVMDVDNLETAIKLAEDLRGVKELAAAKTARRRVNVFNLAENPYAWTNQQRDKLFQFMQHSVYSTRYDVNKLKILRQKYRNSTVYRMALRIGNNLELKTTAGSLYTTMGRMPLDTNMIWYLFHYHKLVNIAHDVTNNVEFIFLLQKTLEVAFLYHTAKPPPQTNEEDFLMRNPEYM